MLVEPGTAGRTAEYLARRLDALSEEHERGWSGVFEETETGPALVFARTLRGVTERYRLDGAFLKTPEARAVAVRAAELQGLCRKAETLQAKYGKRTVQVPVGLIEAWDGIRDQAQQRQCPKVLGTPQPDPARE